MQYARCKCGKAERWDSGYAIHPCEGCSECKTTLSRTESGHKELQPHKFTKKLFNQKTGKPYYMCEVCDEIDRESYELSKQE